jgi:hypothetical protein
MKYFIIILLLTGCATQTQKQYLTKKGYTDIESEKLKPYLKRYTEFMANSFGATANPGSQYAVTNGSNKLSAIYCGCYRHHKELCDGRLSEFPDKESVWLKANAAKLVNNSYAENNMAFVTGHKTLAISSMMCED